MVFAPFAVHATGCGTPLAVGAATEAGMVNV
jgi:hypothetical protein